MSKPAIKDKVLFGGGAQSLRFESPEGRPDADGTCVFRDPRSGTTIAAASTTATRRDIDTTVEDDSGAGQADPRVVACDPPEDLEVGDFVLVTAALGYRERGRVTAIGTESITLADDLVRAYVEDDLVESAEMTSPDIPADWIADMANLGEDFEAVWSYTVGGREYVHRTRWDLVREVPSFQVFDSDILNHFPDLKRAVRFASSPEGFEQCRAAAEQVVFALLEGMGLKPHLVRGTEMVRYLMVLQTLVQIANNGGKPPGYELSVYRQERVEAYETEVGRLLRGEVRIPYDSGNDDTISAEDRRVSVVMLKR